MLTSQVLSLRTLRAVPHLRTVLACRSMSDIPKFWNLKHEVLPPISAREYRGTFKTLKDLGELLINGTSQRFLEGTSRMFEELSAVLYPAVTASGSGSSVAPADSSGDVDSDRAGTGTDTIEVSDGVFLQSMLHSELLSTIRADLRDAPRFSTQVTVTAANLVDYLILVDLGALEDTSFQNCLRISQLCRVYGLRASRHCVTLCDGKLAAVCLQRFFGVTGPTVW